MSDDLVKQALEELQDLVRCRCHDAYKGRGLHDPTCCCDSAEAVKVVSDRIEELEAKLAKAVDVIDWVLICWDDHNEHGYHMQGDWVYDARTILAELTGGNNE